MSAIKGELDYMVHKAILEKRLRYTTDEKAAIIVNFFHHWGMLTKKRYLPMWVYRNATGNGACRLYECVKPYIEARRELNNDTTYGEYFEWLYLKLKSNNISKYIKNKIA